MWEVVSWLVRGLLVVCAVVLGVVVELLAVLVGGAFVLGDDGVRL